MSFTAGPSPRRAPGSILQEGEGTLRALHAPEAPLAARAPRPPPACAPVPPAPRLRPGPLSSAPGGGGAWPLTLWPLRAFRAACCCGRGPSSSPAGRLRGPGGSSGPWPLSSLHHQAAASCSPGASPAPHRELCGTGVEFGVSQEPLSSEMASESRASACLRQGPGRCSRPSSSPQAGWGTRESFKASRVRTPFPTATPHPRSATHRLRRRALALQEEQGPLASVCRKPSRAPPPQAPEGPSPQAGTGGGSPRSPRSPRWAALALSPQPSLRSTAFHAGGVWKRLGGRERGGGGRPPSGPPRATRPEPSGRAWALPGRICGGRRAGAQRHRPNNHPRRSRSGTN